MSELLSSSELAITTLPSRLVCAALTSTSHHQEEQFAAGGDLGRLEPDSAHIVCLPALFVDFASRKLQYCSVLSQQKLRILFHVSRSFATSAWPQLHRPRCCKREVVLPLLTSGLGLHKASQVAASRRCRLSAS